MVSTFGFLLNYDMNNLSSSSMILIYPFILAYFAQSICLVLNKLNREYTKYSSHMITYYKPKRFEQITKLRKVCDYICL